MMHGRAAIDLAIVMALILGSGCGVSSPLAAMDGGAMADGSALTDAAPMGIPYDQDGPIPFTMKVEHVMNGGSTFNVTLYLPMSPGKHPLVSLSCGSQQTAAGYAPYGRRLASYGIAMALSDDPGILTNTSDIVPNAVYLVDTFLPANYGDRIDFTKVALAGHSRGGGVSLLAAEEGLKGKVVAWFGLDPVDDEFFMAPREYARTKLPQIGIPTAFLGAEVVSNCAPVADSYETLYPLAPAPSVLIVGIGAGHTQLEVADACTACAACSPPGTADSDVVLAYATRYFTAFFARELLGDRSVGAAFEGAGAAADVAAGRVKVSSR